MNLKIIKKILEKKSTKHLKKEIQAVDDIVMQGIILRKKKQKLAEKKLKKKIHEMGWGSVILTKKDQEALKKKVEKKISLPKWTPPLEKAPILNRQTLWGNLQKQIAYGRAFYKIPAALRPKKTIYLV